ncbi:MAG: DNA polymerase [Verrucomicrobiota bacterium]
MYTYLASHSMSLRYLFIDFDSFFASVEQQLQPELRGQPVGVVPSLGVETTCCIAASYEAKAYGIKTGTGVREARHLCPQIRFAKGNHRAYVEVHNQIKKLVHEVIYVDEVLSIDEMYGRLPPQWQSREIARSKALEIKDALKTRLGPYIRASIGIAPNRFIAKLASKMEKPNGLVILDFEDLPKALYQVEISDITGIGPGMLRRLHSARIMDMKGLYAASRRKLHKIWGSVEGDRMWYALRGIHLPSWETNTRTISHSHVLPPRFRNTRGAHATLHRMLQKACRRLRAMDYFAGRLIVNVKFGFENRWCMEAPTFPTQDSIILAKMLNQLWETRPSDLPEPTKVSVILTKLIHGRNHTPSLFPEDNNTRRMQLQHTMDSINKKHGNRMIYYANAMEAQQSADAAPMRIAFTHIPDLELEAD